MYSWIAGHQQCLHIAGCTFLNTVPGPLVSVKPPMITVNLGLKGLGYWGISILYMSKKKSHVQIHDNIIANIMAVES